MKEVIIRDKNNKIISNKNLYEDPTEFLELNKKYNTWGRSERWVRAIIDPDLQPEAPDVDIVFSPAEGSEFFEAIEVLEHKVEIENEQEVYYVLLPADYTIEIKDYKRVPTSVSPMQIRLALNRTGLRQIVEEAVANANQDIKDMWEFATEFRRDYPVLLELAQAMNITEDQLDDLFILAETL